MTSSARRAARPAPRRELQLLAFVIGVTVVWLTVLGFAGQGRPDLAVALLVVLAEVLVVAALSGPWLAVVAALAAALLANWYLVPPYRTIEVSNPENLAALAVFTLVAVSSSWLVELAVRARLDAGATRAQAEALAAVVSPEAPSSGLRRVRDALGLDHVVLLGGRPPRVLQESGTDPAPEATEVVVDVSVGGGYRVVGRGLPRVGADPAFVTSLAEAAVRAYESDRMAVERTRADELAAVDRARTALLAGVGHDLRTPLAALRVAVDALQAPGAALSPAHRAELLETIADGADRLDELITNLLDLSRLETGSLITRPVSTDVADAVVRAVVGSADPQRVELDVDDPLPEVVADPVLLERVVANLVSNALRHTPAGTPVSVAVSEASGGVRVAVVDHGPGIPVEHRVEVLAAFHQLPGADDSGSGLGLAVVAGFCAAMGVGLDLGETPGGGLTATLEVPAAPRPHEGLEGP